MRRARFRVTVIERASTAIFPSLTLSSLLFPPSIPFFLSLSLPFFIPSKRLLLSLTRKPIKSQFTVVSPTSRRLIAGGLWNFRQRSVTLTAVATRRKRTYYTHRLSIVYGNIYRDAINPRPGERAEGHLSDARQIIREAWKSICHQAERMKVLNENVTYNASIPG